MPTPEEVAEAARLATEAAAAEAAAKAKDPLKTFEEYLATLDEETRTAFEEHTAGLKSALVKERALNPEGKKALTKLAELQAADEVRKKAEMTDLQKAQLDKKTADEKAAKLQVDLQTERIKNAVLAVASKANFVDPQDAYAMLDRSELEIGDDGTVSGVENAIKALAKAKPYLVGEPGTRKFDLNSGDKGGPPKSPQHDEIVAKKRKGYHPL